MAKKKYILSFMAMAKKKYILSFILALGSLRSDHD